MWVRMRHRNTPQSSSFRIIDERVTERNRSVLRIHSSTGHIMSADAHPTGGFAPIFPESQKKDHILTSLDLVFDVMEFRLLHRVLVERAIESGCVQPVVDTLFHQMHVGSGVRTSISAHTQCQLLNEFIPRGP